MDRGSQATSRFPPDSAMSDAAQKKQQERLAKLVPNEKHNSNNE